MLVLVLIVTFKNTMNIVVMNITDFFVALVILYVGVPMHFIINLVALH